MSEGLVARGGGCTVRDRTRVKGVNRYRKSALSPHFVLGRQPPRLDPPILLVPSLSFPDFIQALPLASTFYILVYFLGCIVHVHNDNR